MSRKAGGNTVISLSLTEASRRRFCRCLSCHYGRSTKWEPIPSSHASPSPFLKDISRWRAVVLAIDPAPASR